MNVAFSIGPKSNSIINVLKKSADNVDFYSYSTISEMIKESLARHIAFSRIIFSTRMLNSNDPDGDLRSLNDFIKNYSNSTEIVMIMMKNDNNDVDKIFNGMFNSPMYTPIILEKATAQCLLDVINEDIAKLKTRYYVLDVGKDRTIVSGGGSNSIVSSGEGSGESAPAASPVVPPKSEPEKKRGLFGIFKGGKVKNTAQNPEPAPATENTPEEVVNTGEMGEKNSNQFSSGPASIDITDSGVTGASENANLNNSEKISGDFGNVTSSSEEPVATGGFSEAEEDENDLSIGNYGEQHTDTGFLDEDEEEELKRLMSGMDESAEDETEAGSGSEDEWSGSGVEEPIAQSPKKPDVWSMGGTPVKSWETREEPAKPREAVPEKDDRELKSEPKFYIDLFVGVKGSGATQSLVDTAAKLTDKEGLKVLIVDLDTRENGLLSYIDTERFYMEGANMGISKLRTYMEDGVYVASNGYGEAVSPRALSAFLSSRLISNFDTVLIDCPAECLDSVSLDVIERCNVYIVTGIDRSDLLATSEALTNRDVVDFQVEKYIMQHCLINFKDEQECDTEDVDWVNRICLFANGNWLDRIGM